MEVSGVKIKMCGNWLGVAIGPGYPLCCHIDYLLGAVEVADEKHKRL